MILSSRQISHINFARCLLIILLLCLSLIFIVNSVNSVCFQRKIKFRQISKVTLLRFNSPRVRRVLKIIKTVNNRNEVSATNDKVGKVRSATINVCSANHVLSILSCSTTFFIYTGGPPTFDHSLCSRHISSKCIYIPRSLNKGSMIWRLKDISDMMANRLRNSRKYNLLI